MVLETAARKRRAFNSHTKAEFWLSCHKYVLSTYYVPDTKVSGIQQQAKQIVSFKELPF